MFSLEWNAKSFVWRILYYHAGHVNMTTPIKPADCLKKHEELNHPRTGISTYSPKVFLMYTGYFLSDDKLTFYK